MPEQLLTILKFCLLALLYLFFLRVLRAVWTEVRTPTPLPESMVTASATVDDGRRARAARPARSSRRSRKDPTQLAVVEPAALAGTTHQLVSEMTFGRAPGCSVIVDDTYASQVHARVFFNDGTWYVEDLGSTNGTYLDRQKVTGPAVLHRGQHLQIGNVVMELR